MNGITATAEEEELLKKIEYVQYSVQDRMLAKDLRIFGMQEWLRGIYQQYIRLYLDFGARREKRYIVADFTNLALGLLRNGIAYAKLLQLVLDGSIGHGISAVLLGVQRVYGMDLRHDGNAVHAAQAGTRA